MTTPPLPAPAALLNPKRAVNVNLLDAQVTEIDSLAEQLGVDRSQMMRWLVDAALPLARAELERQREPIPA